MDREYLYELYVNQQLSTVDIAYKLNVSRSTARRAILKYGFLRTREEGFKLAIPKMGLHLKGKKRIFTPEWKANIRKGAIKRWEGTAIGITLKPNGYYCITRGVNKDRSLQDVIMELHIGRKLKANEVVHHKNEIKTDNEITNLVLMTKSEHCRLHAKNNYSNRKINKKG